MNFKEDFSLTEDRIFTVRSLPVKFPEKCLRGLIIFCPGTIAGASTSSDNLASLGYCALRFDYTGKGNSLGDSTRFCETSAINDVEDLLHKYRYILPEGEPIGIYGKGGGGYVALRTALRNAIVTHCYLYEPIISPKNFLYDNIDRTRYLLSLQDNEWALLKGYKTYGFHINRLADSLSIAQILREDRMNINVALNLHLVKPTKDETKEKDYEELLKSFDEHSIKHAVDRLEGPHDTILYGESHSRQKEMLMHLEKTIIDFFGNMAA